MESADKTNKDKTQSAILTAESVTAAKNENEISQYFDKDGNMIAANSLEQEPDTMNLLMEKER